MRSHTPQPAPQRGSDDESVRESVPIAGAECDRGLVSDRLEDLVESLELGGGEDVLEVGFGHGVAATLVLERLTTGTYTGVDRSAKMVAAAVRRNRDAVDAGRARFLEASFADADLPAAGFDVIFAARVVAMFRPPEQALAQRPVAPWRPTRRWPTTPRPDRSGRGSVRRCGGGRREGVAQA